MKTSVGYDVSWDGDFLFASLMGLKTIAIDIKNFDIIDEHCLGELVDCKLLAIKSSWNTMPGKIFVGA